MSGYPNVALVHSNAQIATTSTAVVAPNTERRYLLITNDSGVTVYIKFGATAVANEGIRLDVGASFEMSPVFNNLDLRAVNGIHASTGTKTILVTEG